MAVGEGTLLAVSNSSVGEPWRIATMVDSEFDTYYGLQLLSVEMAIGERTSWQFGSW